LQRFTGEQVEACGIWDACLAGGRRESDSFVFASRNATAINQPQNRAMMKQLIAGERGDAHTEQTCPASWESLQPALGSVLLC